MTDLGFTHIALEVSDVDRSIAFYQKYAGMQVVHRRTDAHTQVTVAWISDLTRPFVVVLIQTPSVDHPLRPNGHLGVACNSRETVDRLCEQAKQDGVLLKGPSDFGPPVGYWAYLSDPDGHTLEIAYGQEVHLAIADAT